MTAEKHRVAVLCIHGIQGSPNQFHWIVDALPTNTAVVNLLLPGHGGNVQAFRKSSMSEWQTCVDETLHHLSTEYDSMLIIGHSMGCLLAIDACTRCIGKVGALALLATPLHLRPTLRYVKNNFYAAAGIRLQDPFIAAAHAGNSIQASSPLAYFSCIRPYIQLLLKIRAVRSKVDRIQIPLLAIHSRKDEIVSEKSLNCFRNLHATDTLVVPESGHYYYTNSDRDSILHSILALLKTI